MRTPPRPDDVTGRNAAAQRKKGSARARQLARASQTPAAHARARAAAGRPRPQLARPSFSLARARARTEEDGEGGLGAVHSAEDDAVVRVEHLERREVVAKPQPARGRAGGCAHGRSGRAPCAGRGGARAAGAGAGGANDARFVANDALRPVDGRSLGVESDRIHHEAKPARVAEQEGSPTHGAKCA